MSKPHSNHYMQNISQLASLLSNARNTVVFTGAGCSTEAGIPDFRSQDGWWKKIDPAMLANPQAIYAHYPLFQGFYAYRVEQLRTIVPHAGHRILADWQSRGFVKHLITQNVDGLHQMAGNRDVIELHGTIRSFRCHECNGAVSQTQFLDAAPCPHCGLEQRLRANVVMFGESLPTTALQQAETILQAADMVLVIGSSLQVYPANQLPKLCRGSKVLINNEPVHGDAGSFDLFIEGTAGEVLQRVNQLLD